MDAYWRVDAKPKCTYSTVSTFPTFCMFSCAFHVHYGFQGGMQNGGWMQIPDAGFLHVFYVSCVFYASNPVFLPTSNVALHFGCHGDDLHTMVTCKTPGV